MHLDRDSFLRSQDHLELLLFVQGAVEEGQEALVSDVWSELGWISVELSQKLGMVITVEQFNSSLGMGSLERSEIGQRCEN